MLYFSHLKMLSSQGLKISQHIRRIQLIKQKSLPSPRTANKLHTNGHNILNNGTGYLWHSNKQTAILGPVCRDRVHWALLAIK